MARDAPETEAYPLLFADHEEIRDILTDWGEGVTASEASRFVDHGVFDSDATGLRFAPHFRPRPH